MKACVTGATGFLGAHVVRALAERGDDVRVVYRDPDRLKALTGIRYRRAKCDVLDFRRDATRPARQRRAVPRRRLRRVEPVQSVWELNAEGPVVAVEAAAAEGVAGWCSPRRSRPSATANGTARRTSRPTTRADWLGLAYPDSKHAGRDAPRSTWPTGTSVERRGGQSRLRPRRSGQPLPAGRDLHPDDRQLPARPAARRCWTRR